MEKQRELYKLFLYFSEENLFWDRKRPKDIRKAPFCYSEFIWNLYPKNESEGVVYCREKKKARTRLFVNSGNSETTPAKDAIMSNFETWKGINSYLDTPAQIYTNRSRDDVVAWIRDNYVTNLSAWLKGWGMTENESLRTILSGVREALDGELESEVLFFHRGLTSITIESVADTLYDFLLYYVAGVVPNYVDKVVCEKYREDLREANNHMHIGAAESKIQLMARREILHMKKNCVVMYSVASDYYSGNTPTGKPNVRMAIACIENLLSINVNFPMPHYLRAKIYLNYVEERKKKNNQLSFLEEQYQHKEEYYKLIVKDATVACTYGIGGAYVILGDLVTNADCPAEAKQEIGVKIPQNPREKKAELRVRIQRHLYRFGMYCENSTAALKLASLLNGDGKNREKMESLAMAAKFGEAEACYELIKLSIENHVDEIYESAIVTSLNCICAICEDERIEEDFIIPLVKIVRDWYDNGNEDFIERLCQYANRIDCHNRVVGLLMNQGYFCVKVTEIENEQVALSLKPQKLTGKIVFETAILFGRKD